MFGIKKSFLFTVIIVFILLTLCAQTVPKMQYYSRVKQSNQAELEMLVKKYPSYPEAYIVLGEKYSNTNPEKAVACYEKAAEIVNNKNFEAAMDEYIATAYLKNGNAISAVKYYSNPILVKYNLTTNLMLANILRITGRFDEAINVLDLFEKNAFLSIASAEPDMFTRLRYEFFYNILSSVENAYAVKNSLLLAKAVIYCEKKDYNKSLELLNRYMKASNKIPVSLFLRIYTAKSDLKSAKKYYDMLDKDKKNNTVADNFSKGLYFIAAGDYKAAENIFIPMAQDYKLNKTPKELYGLYGLGLVNMHRGNYKSSIKYFSDALVIRPYSYELTVKLAECYKKTGDIKSYNKLNLKLKALLTY